MKNIAVFPAYWGCGHGTSLLNVAQRQADASGAKMAASIAPKSRNIFENAGFDIENLLVKYGESSFGMGLGVYTPQWVKWGSETPS